LADDLVVRQHRHHNLRAGERGRGRCRGAGVLSSEALLTLRVDVSNRQPEAGADQVARHWPTHVAKADEPDVKAVTHRRASSLACCISHLRSVRSRFVSGI
jgi:hypothetical protein